MANTIGWGQGSANNTNQWGRGSSNNSINWGNIYGNSPSGETNIIGGIQPTFKLKYDLISTDFTFTRNSFATRVNEFGLIETVTDLGNELIDYSNLTYGTGGWSLVNGKWFFDDVTSGFLSTDDFDVVVGEQYEVTVDVTISSGNANFRVSSGNAQTILFQYTDFPNGVTKFVTTVTGIDGSVNRLFAPDSLTDNPFTLNSISVKKVLEDDVPRIDYSTGEPAFLLEPQSTNLLPYSEDFSDSSFNDYGETNVALDNAEVNPYGELGSYKITSTSGLGRFGTTISVTPSTDYTVSFYAKNTDASAVRLFFTNTASASSTNYESSINSNGWSRVEFSFTTSSGTSTTIQLVRDLPVGESLYLWGVQVEELTYATSYIPTNGSTVTRSAELCVDATPTINSEEGVLYAEISALANEGSFRLMSLSDGTQNNTVYIGYDGTSANRLTSAVRVSTSYEFLETHNISDSTDIIKVALKYKENDFAFWVNGVKVDTDLVGSVFSANTLTKLSFNRGGGSLPFYGNTKDLRIYDKALTDDELIKLTTI